LVKFGTQRRRFPRNELAYDRSQLSYHFHPRAKTRTYTSDRRGMRRIVGVRERTHDRAHPRFSSPTFHAALYPRMQLFARADTRATPTATLHRRRASGSVVSRVANPFHPVPTLQRGWVGVVGCVYEATGPKLKGIPPRQTPERGSRGGRAAITDKRKTVSEGNPIGGRRRRDVPTSLVRSRSAGRGDTARWWGRRIPGNDYQKASRGFVRRQRIQHGGDSAILPSLPPSLSLSLSLPSLHHSDARRRSTTLDRATSIATDCSRPLSWIPLDLFSGTLQESKVSSVDQSLRRSVGLLSF